MTKSNFQNGFFDSLAETVEKGSVSEHIYLEFCYIVIF